MSAEFDDLEYDHVMMKMTFEFSADEEHPTIGNTLMIFVSTERSFFKFLLSFQK